ncbi:MAG: LPS-assembly protein LptD [Candidatus Omnitrophota bacterium]|jgi:lipopolysaccharide assembly outer membrane protein LptD (OstA)|nr:MAG: LPS-assembly protein LptD [Candidatus Omnitrophota bacterium]
MPIDYSKMRAISKVLLTILCLLVFSGASAEEAKDNKPVIVNADVLEYATEKNEVVASGNVSITYKGSKLTCDKITVDTVTKDAVAEGNVRLDDKQGTVEGKKIIYNLDSKTGVIMDAEFRSNPYFGKAARVDKPSEKEFIALDGYASSCSFDNPHYRIKSGKINVFPDDKIQTKNDVFLIGKIPIMYLPRFNHSLKDPLMHVQVTPGKSKDWGPYILTAWRYNLSDTVSGRIYADYRSRLGVAEGFGANYVTKDLFGKGDFKYYYTQERDNTLEQGTPAEFERYLIRWRHKWDIDRNTDLTSEYYKITDSKRIIIGSDNNFLKDYFYREYEKDSQPLSYVQVHRNFTNSSLDLLLQKRVNRWYTQLEKLPEVNYSLPSIQVGNSSVYYEHTSQAANFNYKYAVPSDSNNDIQMSRFDTTNKFSLPMKVSFVKFTPFVMNRETFYSSDIGNSSVHPRTIFYTGADLSTKFFRIFDVKTNFLKLDIDKLRHIITPTIGYAYNHEPTVKSSQLKQIDSIDSIAQNNSVTLGISNKFQTKRDNISVDLADFRVSSIYYNKPDSGVKTGSYLSDILFEMELHPYSWLSIDSDATWEHSGDRNSDPNYGKFSSINYDINFNFGNDRAIGIGQRYERKGSDEITQSLNWRLNPKWKFSAYLRSNIGSDTSVAKGLNEQEYTISRDLHCWSWDLTYNVKRDEGETIWLIFRLKAFPETEFGFNQSYHGPKTGSQSQ